MKSLKNIFWVLGILIFVFSCGNPPTEDEQFVLFQNKFEKTYQKIFPERMETTVDSLIDFSLTESEIIRRVDFCKENLDRLDAFDIAALSKENRTAFKAVFTKLKEGLGEMQTEADGLNKK